MSSTDQVRETVDLDVVNIGGIDEKHVTFQPGVTVLTGRNATNRTSLLQAIMAALGSDHVSLKADADEGSVSLSWGGDTYTRTLTRDGETVVTSGDPHLDDPELSDLFAFLLESNEARRAVVRDDDLHELIMRPVDTEEIQNEIEALVAEKQRIDEQIKNIDGLENDLTDLKRRLGEIDDEIETKEDELADKEAEIDAADADVEETRNEKSRLDEKFEELRDKRAELESVRAEIERKQEGVESLVDRREELETEQIEVPEAPMGEVREIEGTIDQLREELRTVTATINEIQTIIQFNEDKLEESNSEIAEALGVNTSDSDAVTDRLVQQENVVCWTCGSEVEKSAVEETLQQLKDLNQTKFERKRELNDRIDELKEDKIEYTEKQRQREQIERELETVEEKIEQREERIRSLRERRSELGETVTNLEATVEDLENETYSEILDLHKEANQIEFELGQLKQEQKNVEQEIDRIESQLEECDRLKAEREKTNQELESLRTKIERIEAQAVEAFNEHMDAVLSIMEFENIERIWIEQAQERVRKGREKVTETVFDLHVVRTSADGATYEDRIQHLSESERETTGLVFALAGYLVHDIHEDVPFIILDSLEAIDADRIATLLDYMSEYAEFLIVALLPEDAEAVDTDHQQLTEF